MPRLAFIDALKAIASQLIVLHHLAFYGPMSDVASALAPGLFSWLSQDARIAVQVFLVIGGYLAAKTLAPAGALKTITPLSLLLKRYFKLVIPYIAAVLLSVLCAWFARQLMDDDSIPDPATFKQMLAHVALLQGVLGFDSLSAGAWYVAIDFQLFCLLLAVLWLARSLGDERGQFLALVLVAGLALVSLFYFNRDSNWDDWGLYFFGAYSLGVFACWTTASATNRRHHPGWLVMMAVVVVVALVVDFRSRIAVALLTALALAISGRWGFIEDRPRMKVLAYLGKISYSVFLVHFPIVLVTNAIFSRIAPASALANAFGIVIAWAGSVAVGALFYRFVESRSVHWLDVANDALRRSVGWLVPVFRTKP